MMISRRPSLLAVSLLLFLVVAITQTCQVSAFPRQRSIDQNNSKFSRERVKLSLNNNNNNDNNNNNNNNINGSHQNGNHNGISSSSSKTPISPDPLKRERQEFLLKLDALIGVMYATGFFLFPGMTLNLFFRYNLEDNASLLPLLKLAVRMIALNHFGYIAGLLGASPDYAIQVATVFLSVCAIFVVYYAQLRLNTAVEFWSCTFLTTLLLAAHMMAL